MKVEVCFAAKIYVEMELLPEEEAALLTPKNAEEFFQALLQLEEDGSDLLNADGAEAATDFSYEVDELVGVADTETGLEIYAEDSSEEPDTN